jgi:hypothetical protein
MSPNRIAYTLNVGGRKAGISIRLDVAVPKAPSALLRLFHEAAGTWERTHRGQSLRSEQDGDPLPDTEHVSAADYLYADNSFNGQRFHRHLSMLAEHGSIHRFVPQPGAPVEGRDLWGREQETTRLWACIHRGSCHIQGPRRYGKTSLLRYLETRLAVEKRPAVLAEVSACTNASDFFAALATEAMDNALLHARLAGALRELRGWPAAGPASDADQRSAARTRLLAAIRDEPALFGERLLAALAQAKTVLMIDEFSLFLRQMLERSQDETRRVLEILRRARRGSPALRQVVAGSAGLTAYACFHGLGDLLDDLAPVPVNPLDVPHAKALAEELIYGAGLRPSPAMAAAVIADVGLPVPYFIQALCDAARVQAGAATTVEEATVHAAYRERVLGPVGNHLFRVYRLDNQPYPDHLRGAAARILTAVARSAGGATRAALAAAFSAECPDAVAQFDSLLACLSEDYDLEQAGSRWRFRSKALRERWLLFGQMSPRSLIP